MSVRSLNQAERPGAEAERGPAIQELLGLVLEMGGSDLHLLAGTPPAVRLHGDLVPLRGYGELEPAGLERMVYAILRQGQREQFEQEMELDVSYSLPGRARFRVNVYRQRDSVGAAFRLVPASIPSLDELGLPARVAEFAREPRGLVLVTGPDGLRQVDDARGARGHHQPRPGVSHRDDRGPHRVPARAQDGHGEPTGSAATRAG